MDPAGIQAASQKAFRIQQLLLEAIKKALSWPMDQPPRIEPEGAVMVGVPGLICQTTATGSNYYDRPGVYPAGA
jgi:hypothetical protein